MPNQGDSIASNYITNTFKWFSEQLRSIRWHSMNFDFYYGFSWYTWFSTIHFADRYFIIVGKAFKFFKVQRSLWLGFFVFQHFSMDYFLFYVPWGRHTQGCSIHQTMVAFSLRCSAETTGRDGGSHRLPIHEPSHGTGVFRLKLVESKFAQPVVWTRTDVWAWKVRVRGSGGYCLYILPLEVLAQLARSI